MPKLDIITLDGTTNGQFDLPAVLTVEPKKELLHQAVVMYLANQRQSNAHTKTRGLVRGGGRKPWKQKGTGRARAGSSRSPLWIGGGITFGPTNERNYSKRMPTKMKRLALAMAFSTKATANELIIVDEFKFTALKTKEAAAALKKIAPSAKSILIITPSINAELLQVTGNLGYVGVTTVTELNTYDIMNASCIVVTKDAVDTIATMLGKE